VEIACKRCERLWKNSPSFNAGLIELVSLSIRVWCAASVKGAPFYSEFVSSKPAVTRSGILKTRWIDETLTTISILPALFSRLALMLVTRASGRKNEDRPHRPRAGGVVCMREAGGPAWDSVASELTRYPVELFRIEVDSANFFGGSVDFASAQTTI
jgi:hypothetical protein